MQRSLKLLFSFIIKAHNVLTFDPKTFQAFNYMLYISVFCKKAKKASGLFFSSFFRVVKIELIPSQQLLFDLVCLMCCTYMCNRYICLCCMCVSQCVYFLQTLKKMRKCIQFIERPQPFSRFKRSQKKKERKKGS